MIQVLTKNDISELTTRLLSGDRIALARAITLAESQLTEHQVYASEILQNINSKTGNSLRIAITGVPGAGKSTFINCLGERLCQAGNKVAVLSIDPSSEKSKGSILGDKTRMEALSKEENAFIRPSPSSGELGGVARRTREALLLCEAAGYEIILIETVGVGQSETAVQHLSDIFVLLLITGAGDDLQGIKRGIMELADIIVINKADGENLNVAKSYRQQIANSIHLFPASNSGWIPQTLTCSSIQNTDIDKVWSSIESYFIKVKSNGFFKSKREKEIEYWQQKNIEEILVSDFQKSHIFKTFLNQNRSADLGFNELRKLINNYYAAIQLPQHENL